ncbi:helix-turn-helix transcriptional regulator [Luteimonas marina]|nr:helix-turn-helix transcriptional regulator [Luteimonas marina]
MDPGTLLEAIGQVYASMFDEDAERGWLDQVRDLAGAEHAVLSEARGPKLTMHISRMDAGMEPLARQLAATTLYDNPLARMPSRRVHRMSDYFPIRDLMRTQVYQQFVRPLHGGYALAFPWGVEDGRAAIAICRDATRTRDFADAECTALQPLLLHIHNGFRIRARMQALQASLDQAHAALDAMHEAVLIVDRARRVRYLNPQAWNLLADGDGIRLDAGALHATRAYDDRRLQALVASALTVATRLQSPDARGAAAPEWADPRLAIPRDAPRRPLLASVAPATAVAHRHGLSDFADAAIVLLRDPDRPPAGSTRALVALFALTPREAELAMALRDGSPLALASTRLGIAEGTARQYLKQVFAKTGVGRQAELVALLRNLC